MSVWACTTLPGVNPVLTQVYLDVDERSELKNSTRTNKKRMIKGSNPTNAHKPVTGVSKWDKERKVVHKRDSLTSQLPWSFIRGRASFPDISGKGVCSSKKAIAFWKETWGLLEEKNLCQQIPKKHHGVCFDLFLFSISFPALSRRTYLKSNWWRFMSKC